MDLLREAGFQFHYDEDLQSYRIADSYILPPTNFTAEEALAVIALCHELGGAGQLPFYQSARSAATKLESSLPTKLRQQMRKIAQSIRIQAPPVNPLSGQETIYQQLVDAIAARQAVRIQYDSLHEQSTIQTRLDPYRLLFSRRSWYVIGRSSLHRATRTFNLGRIKQLERLEASFRIPRGFTIERHLGNAWNLVPEKGLDQQVTIRFGPKVARNVAEVRWHKTQQVEQRDDGSIDFRVTVSGLNEISWWILGYGDQAEVLKPRQLRELVVQRARNMLANYDGV